MTTTTIEMYEPPRAEDITNDHRAEMVRPLVQAFHDAYYFHKDGEPLATVIGDMIADMLHLADRLDSDQFDLAPASAEAILDHAENHYTYEIEEEAMLREEDHAAPTDT